MINVRVDPERNIKTVVLKIIEMDRSHQVRMFNVLLTSLCKQAKLDREETKRQMIHDVTQGRTLHTADVTDEELKILTDHIVECSRQAGIKQSGDKMRKKILHYCHLMQWYNGSKLDWARIDAFCVDRGYRHKKFREYTVYDLPTLVSQFEEVYKSFLKKI